MRTEMKKLQHAQREHVRQQQEIINQEAKLRNLRMQLQELKTVKVYIQYKRCVSLNIIFNINILYYYY